MVTAWLCCIGFLYIARLMVGARSEIFIELVTAGARLGLVRWRCAASGARQQTCGVKTTRHVRRIL